MSYGDTRSMTADAALADIIRARVTPGQPLLVGVGGPVAVGKTTIVRGVAAALAARALAVEVLSTDAFLLANDALNERGLLMRKGYPETYDGAAMVRALSALRAGSPAAVPVYSHEAYDIVAGGWQTITPADVILIEGIAALQPPAADHLDLAIYVEAPERCVRQWFVDRFLQLTAAAADDAASFYHPFAALPAEQVREIAVATWDTINAPNLREHIAPSAGRADVIVRKDPDHAVAELRMG